MNLLDLPQDAITSILRELPQNALTCIVISRVCTKMRDCIRECNIECTATDLCADAAAINSIGLLTMLMLEGHPITKLTSFTAISHNHPGIIAWILSIGYELDDDDFECAAGVGTVEMLELFRNYPLKSKFMCIFTAVLCGNLETVIWLHANNFCDNFILFVAIKGVASGMGTNILPYLYDKKRCTQNEFDQIVAFYKLVDQSQQ